MDSPDTGSNLSASEVRKEAISAIIATDKKAFYEWSANSGNQGKLALPESALRYMVIPPRILELAEDPTKIGLDIVETSATGVWALVVEHKSVPVTNMSSRRKYLDEREEFSKAERTKQGNPRVFIIPETGGPTLPNDVDPYHVAPKYLKVVEEGIFSPNDYFLNNIQLTASDINPQVLCVADYRIRDSLQRIGIGTSFYTRLRECARKLGFRFLTGQNWENNNITYFRDKLGRSTLDQIKSEKRKDFANMSAELAKLYTIDFLYPEDKAVYIQENK